MAEKGVILLLQPPPHIFSLQGAGEKFFPAPYLFFLHPVFTVPASFPKHTTTAPPKPDFTQTSSPHVKSIFLPLLHFVPHSKRFVTLFSPQAKKLSFLYPMPCFSEKMSKPFHAQHVSLNRRKYVILKI